ncbi:uncharacterized protein LOC116850751 [Odontomachus brunneus]|uniref:uncharacterized protein LOC116850751 n=1 Tax=Odontomachus brunneus TaxID=486640 RepID=UPI0013F2103C|nr:uncharacterized protein LOC116850751 [Odontomachus brunneus]
MNIFGAMSKFNGPFHEDKYNQFFNPNLCHVCKSPNDGKLIPCDRCYSIYYCCKEHKAMHEESHRKVCEGLTLAISFDPHWYTRCCNFKEWIDLKRSLVIFIKMHISRKLYPYEIEMCFCAKSCDICHRMINLQTCTYCYSINYCDKHIRSMTSHVDCQNRLLLLDLNIANINNNVCNEYPEHLKNTKFPVKRNYYSMLSFVNAYTNHPKGDMWTNKLYIFTDYMTGPLTLYNAFGKANLLNYPRQHREFVIHIIAGSALDVASLKAWQILLHLFFTVKKLHIVMIKPETVFESVKYNLCHKSITRNQELYFEYVSESYYNYEVYGRKQLLL